MHSSWPTLLAGRIFATFGSGSVTIMCAFSWPLGWLSVAVRGIATRSSLPLLCVAVRIGQRAQRVTPVRPYRRRLVVLVVIVLVEVVLL